MACATKGQLAELGSIVANRVDPSRCDRQKVQEAILDPKGFASDFATFLMNRGVAPVVTDILRPVPNAQNPFLPATDGKITIAQASDVFPAGIDGDFKRWGLDVPGEARGEALLSAHEMVQDGDFKQIFGSFGVDLDRLALTQDQIVTFCRLHHRHLRTEGYATFFLFKENNAFFVAGVRWRDARELEVHVYRLSYDRVWFGDSHRRMVVPQLTPASSGA